MIAISAARFPVAGERVVATVGVDRQLLGRADVDGERRGIDPIEADPGAVRRRRELLGSVAAVDLGRVGAGAALVEVGVVTGVPDHAIVAPAAERQVVGVATGQRVVAGAPEQRVEAALAEEGVVATLTREPVRARAAGEGVVAATAEQVGARERAVRLIERDDVVAGAGRSADIELGVGDRRCSAGDHHGTAVHPDRPRRVAADRDACSPGRHP